MQERICTGDTSRLICFQVLSLTLLWSSSWKYPFRCECFCCTGTVVVCNKLRLSATKMSKECHLFDTAGYWSVHCIFEWRHPSIDVFIAGGSVLFFYDWFWFVLLTSNTLSDQPKMQPLLFTFALLTVFGGLASVRPMSRNWLSWFSSKRGLQMLEEKIWKQNCNYFG